MTFIVLSRNFVGHPVGSVLSDEDLKTCNVPALIEGGHLAIQETAHDPADEAHTRKKE